MAGIDDGAADRDAMAAEPFGHGMHHDIGTVIGRAREIGRRKGVVDQERKPGLMRDCRDRGNIEHFEPGIADGLGDHQFRVWA